MPDLITRNWPAADLDSPFSSGAEGTGAVIEGSASAARGGSGFGLRSYISGAGGMTDAAWARYSFATTTSIAEAEVWMNLVTTPASGDGIVAILELRDSNYTARVQWSGPGFNNRWELEMRRKDGTDTSAAFTMPGGTGFKQWRLIYDGSGANPIARLVVDDTQLVSITDTTSGTLAMPTLIHLGAREDQWGAVATELYFDDLVVRDAVTALGGPTLRATFARFPKFLLSRRGVR